MAENRLSPAQQALYNNEGEARNRAIRIQMLSLTPDMYQNFNDITSKYPGMSKDLIMGMVKQGVPADTPGIGKIASLDGIAQLKRDQFNVDKIKSTVGNNKGIVGSIFDSTFGKVYDVLKGATRVGFATLRLPYDLATTMTRDIAQEKSPGLFIKNLSMLGGKNTLLGSLVADAFDFKGGVKTGDGFFINPKSRVGKDQAKAMAAYGKVNGQSFTIGRYVAKSIESNPNKTGYRVLSGLVDATLNIALDPTFWFGAGSARAILKGRKEAAKFKKEAEQFSREAQVAKETAEIKKLALEREELVGQYTSRSDAQWMEKSKELTTLEAEKINRLLPTTQAFLGNLEGSLVAFSKDEVAQTVLATDNIAREIITNPSTFDGELLRGIDKLAAESTNTAGFTNGFIVLENAPKPGVISFGADKTDEFAVTLSGADELKFLDLTEDIKSLPKTEMQAEVNRRVMFEEWLEAGKVDKALSPEARAILQEISNVSRNDAIALKGFAWAVSAADEPRTLAQILEPIMKARGTEGAAIAMRYALEGIQKTWQFDGISNIRALYGETGGVMITNTQRLAAVTGQFGIALSKLAGTTSGDLSALGPAVTELVSGVKGLDDKIKSVRGELDVATKNKEVIDQRLKEIQIFSNVVKQDLALSKAIRNDPEYQGLAKIIDLDEGIAERRILREWIQENVGLTKGYNGDLSTDFSGAFKFMLGRSFGRIAEIVAKETDANTINRFFGRRLDADMVNELAAVSTTDDVYRVFLSYLGNPTTNPTVFRSLTLRKEVQKLTANPVARMVNPISLVSVRNAERLEKTFSRYYVRSTVVNLGDLNQTVNSWEDWVSSAAIRGALGVKAAEKFIDDISTKLFKSTSEQQRSAIIQDGLADIVKALTTKYDLPEGAVSELTSLIKINKVQAAADKLYTNGKLSENGEVLLLNIGNTPIKLDGGIHFYQLAQGTIFLPDSRSVVKALNKLEKNMLKNKAKAIKIGIEETGDVWRTTQLVFRVSYMVRNIAEMQMRQMFSGHTNIISNPFQFTAMMLANAGKGGPLVNRIAKYQYDLGGSQFNNLAAEGEFLEAVRGYQTWAFRRASVSDYRSGKNSEVFKVYKVIGSGDKQYFEGLAHTLNRWGSDKFNPKIARLMLAGDEGAKRKFVQDAINDFDSPNSDIRNYVLGIYDNNDGLKNLFLRDTAVAKDKLTKDDLDADKIFKFFFDDSQSHTLAGQMKEMAGTGPKSYVLTDLLAEGKATFVNNKGKTVTLSIPWFDGPLNSTQLSALESAFQKALKNNFDAADLTGSRVLFQKQSVVSTADKTQINGLVDSFFNIAARLESKFNFGPEYQMAYWDFVARYADMLGADELKYVRNQALKSLNPINMRVGNKVKVVGKKHPVLRILDSRIKEVSKGKVEAGTSNWQTIHQMAARDASTYVKNLFYDANRQKRWAQASRLILPFAQAHTNTLYKWSQLSYQSRLIPAYKFGRAYNALTKEDTNVIYDVAGITYNDDQGFIYREPGREDAQFRMPLAGNIIGAYAGRNLKMSDAMQITSPVQSLNLAFGAVNPLIPGLGPAAALAFVYSGKSDDFGSAYDIMRDIVTPFGAPDSIEDIIFPAWFRKSFLYKMNNKEAIQRNTKDWAAYLASTGDYGDNPFANDEIRTRLFNDAQDAAQRMGFATALFQSISPATPIAEVLVKIKDTDNKLKFMTMTMLFEHWDRISKDNPGNYGEAVREFADIYGMNNILVTLGKTTSAVAGTEDAWNWLNQNPTAADKYARSPGDIVPYFFPGGAEFAIKYYNWQKKTGARRVLSTKEISDEAEGLIYSMLKSQIAEEQLANYYPDFWYRQKVAQLDKDFGGPPPDTITTNTPQEKIARIGLALQDPAFQRSTVYTQAATFYTQYQEFQELLNYLKGANYAEIKSKSSMAPMLRDKLVSLAETLMSENPAFARMYYGVFAGQLEG